MSDKKSAGEALSEKLIQKKENGWEKVDTEQEKQIFAYAKGYADFLNAAKTEREAVCWFEEKFRQEGILPFDSTKSYRPGDRCYVVNRGKNIVLCTIGKRPICDGILLSVAHIDAPRLDLKQNPLYEDGGIAFLKTHYYGGIKKYQWTALPLSLHGTIVRADGSVQKVVIGEEEQDPVFCITDLLPHLAEIRCKNRVKI